MPSLHNFDTCWGHRRYLHDVYCELSPYDWLHDHEASLSLPSSSRGFSSSNGYYGYQPVAEARPPCEPTHTMDVETVPPQDSLSRKRPNSNSSHYHQSKRVKSDSGGGW